MFTGLIEEVGQITSARALASGGRELGIRAPGACRELRPGDSICADGVCLTVESVRGERFLACLMPPTAAATTLGGAAAGRRVNLELPLRAGDRLGGHIVQGHVDAVARVIGLSRRGETVGMEIASPSELEPYLADKGSVAVDGVSLTLARVGGGRFAVSLVRATLERTNLGERKPGDLVNLEADIIAKYVARFLLHRERALRPPGAGDLSLAAAEARERALAGLLEEGEQV